MPNINYIRRLLTNSGLAINSISNWILATGFWRDSAIWIDSDIWVD